MQRFSVILLAGMIGATVSGAVRAEGASTRVAIIPYEECLSIISEASQEVDGKPVDLVSTGELKVVRIGAADGFVTISCSRRDNKMTLTKSPVPGAAGMTASR